MLLSQLVGERYREIPAGAQLASHIFLLRGGYIRQVAGGIFSLLPPARRIVSKLEDIIRQEMDAIGGQEVLLPCMLPADLWKESGRYETVGRELMRLNDRAGRPMVLGMTHEEAAVQLARSEAGSHLDYPFMIYQIQTKFRDEPRPRGGLIRVREFTMKDAYSFHTSQEDLQRYYDTVRRAYARIFQRAGLPDVLEVRSDSGMMGGPSAHEFMYLSEGGEDTLVVCGHCGYRANMEVAVSKISRNPLPEETLREVHTPECRDIASLALLLSVEPCRILKAAVFRRTDTGKPVAVFLRGDLQVNEAKLRRVLGADVVPYEEDGEEIFCFGYIGPLGLEAETQIIYDKSVAGETNLVCGANRREYHYTGLSVPRDLPGIPFADVAKVEEGHACPDCGSPLQLRRGIEVGNIFQLGTKYTESMHMAYTDAAGQRQTPVMGCYGIGVGRLLACILEQNHDEYGPIWPAAVAPWTIHICVLGGSKALKDAAFSLYKELSAEYEVILDDRGAGAGVQFADADLLGAPLRVIFGKKSWENGEAELCTRDKRVREQVKIEDAAAYIKAHALRLFL